MLLALLLFLTSPLALATDAQPLDYYLSKVQPVLDKRCAVCHSCFEAPCQLKLTSPEMVLRGANKHPTNGGFLSASPRTDLMLTPSEQEAGGFFSVLQGGANSIFVNLLAAGAGPKPVERYVPPSKRQCVADSRDLQSLKPAQRAALGMPYFMAPLSDQEYSTLVNWASRGARMPDAATLRQLAQPKSPKLIQAWEHFFNTPTWKARWTSRYLYEHLFTAHFHFEESPGEFYEIVRSRTAAPLEIDQIATERPFVMPAELADRFYYRLKKVTSTIIHKQHFVYHVSSGTMDELKSLFWNSSWGSSELEKPFSFKDPNPFFAFAHIPANARYRWMLRNARMLLDMDMRSDNCHGNGATGPLHENFLIFFIKPESDVAVRYSDEYFKRANPYLEMANTGKSTGTINAVMNTNFKSNQIHYSRVKNAYQQALLPNGLTFVDVWDGEGETQTPFFTLMRHEGTVSMHNGAWGPIQRVSLLFDYVNFERLYYNCVALSTLFDNVTDKLGTVLYLRDVGRELEEQFLSLLPEEYRDEVRADWVQGDGARNTYDASKFSLRYNPQLRAKLGTYIDPSMPYRSTVHALLTRSGRFSSKSVGPYYYPTSVDTAEFRKLKEVAAKLSVLATYDTRHGVGNSAHQFPNVSVVIVKAKDGGLRYYTVVASRFYEYINYLKMTPPGHFNHGRDPRRDYMGIYPGLHINYPGKFFVTDEKYFDLFVNQMAQVKTRSDYVDFDRTWGVQKMSQEFWSTVDRVQQDFVNSDPVMNGMLDLSEYGVTDLRGSP